MSDDAAVWADYHHAEVKRRDREIAALKQALKEAGIDRGDCRGSWHSCVAWIADRAAELLRVPE